MATESAPDHDVLWVVDTDEAFGDYLPFRTYTPRPVVGTQGMQALAWDPSYTEYGAMSFQNAIRKLAKRDADRARLYGLAGASRSCRRRHALGQDHRAGAQGHSSSPTALRSKASRGMR